MNPNTPDRPFDIDATRALADGEAVPAGGPVSREGIAYESQLRQVVGRVMSEIPAASPALGEKIDSALAEDEALRFRVKTLLDRSIGRETAPKTAQRRWTQRWNWLPLTTAAAALVVAVGTVMWTMSMESDAMFPLSKALENQLESVYADAEKSPATSATNIDAALDEAAQLFGQRPMGIEFAAGSANGKAELLWARASRTPSGGQGFELGFGVYPPGVTQLSERREVTLVIGTDDDFSRGQMSDSRLYRILGSDLMVRGWRYGGLTYFMTAESKRALLSLQNAMRIPETIEAHCDWPESR